MSQGDRNAAGELFRRLSPRVYPLVLRITGNPEDGEEVLVDAFQQAWSQAHLYDPQRATVMAWLLSIARSRALDLVRARRRREARHEMLSESPDPTAPEAVSPEGEAMLGEVRDQLRALLALLPAEQRQALELAYFGGYSHQEIAQRLGQPLGTVKTRLRLAIRKIRSSIADVDMVGG
jgi:RNA polymerase sigma-70 factor (ECF subfamily)